MTTDDRIEKLESTIFDLRLKLHAQRLLIRRLEAVNDDLRLQNAHLLDQPLVILNGDAFIGSRDYRQPCPN